MANEQGIPSGHVDLGGRVIAEHEVGDKIVAALFERPLSYSSPSKRVYSAAEMIPQPNPDFFWALFNLKTGLQVLQITSMGLPVPDHAVQTLGENLGKLHKAIAAWELNPEKLEAHGIEPGKLDDIETDYILPLAAKIKQDTSGNKVPVYILFSNYANVVFREDATVSYENIAALQELKVQELMRRLDELDGGDPSGVREPRKPIQPADSAPMAIQEPTG